MQRADQLIIPKLGHCIWVGFNPAPGQHLEKLLRWVQVNQYDGFQFILWIDKKLASENVIPFYLEFFQSRGIYIVDCTDRKSSKAPLIIRDLLELEDNPVYSYISLKLKRNYAEISDFSRYRLLKLFGGFYFDLPDIEKGQQKLIESGLFDRVFPNHILACDYQPQSTRRPDIKSIKTFITCNDALITTPNNPIINSVLETIINNLSSPTTIENLCWAAYGQENFFHTINTTGPQVLTNTLSGVYKLPSGAFQVNFQGQLIDLPPLRDLSYSFIEHTPRHHDVGLTWFCTPVVKAAELLGGKRTEEEAIELAFQIVINSILFELKELEVLRLDSHIDELVESTGMTAPIVALRLIAYLQSLNLDYSEVQLSQLTYRHPQTIEFYNQRKLLETTHSSWPSITDEPMESEVFKKIIDCISCKSYVLSEHLFDGHPNRATVQFQRWIVNFFMYLENLLQRTNPHVDLENIYYIFDILDNPLYKHFISIAFSGNAKAHQIMGIRHTQILNDLSTLLSTYDESIASLRTKVISDPNALGEDGVRLLHYSIRNNLFEDVFKLITHPLIDTTLINDDGTGLLNEICSPAVRTVAILTILASCKPLELLRVDSQGNNLIHYLCMFNLYDLNIRKLLIDLHVPINVNLPNAVGDTPISFAANHVNQEMTTALLLDATPQVTLLNVRGFSPIHVAAIINNPGFISQALASLPPLFNPNQLDARNNTPLLLALKHRSYEVVLRLLADPRVLASGINQDNESSVSLFLLNMNQVAYAPMILSDLLRRGGSPDQPITVMKNEIQFLIPTATLTLGSYIELSPLHLAVLLGRADFATILLEAGVSPHVKYSGYSALELATVLGKENLIKILSQIPKAMSGIFQTSATPQTAPTYQVISKLSK